MEEISDQDRRLLGALQDDCRQSAQDLAAAVNLSPATCWRRQKSLEERGLIAGYRAVLDRQKLGLAVSAYVHVTVERQFANVIAEIEKKIKERPEVTECCATTGDADFTLRVVAKDIAAYDRFLQRFLEELPGIGQVRSSIVLREIKATTKLPLD
ncbi:MAG: Lrp/AsnC family transcriptional regulator [Parvularculaceae bacterium]